MVTHDFSSVEDLATRVIQIHDGKILSDKKIKEIPENENNIQTKQYQNIGIFNIIKLGIRNSFNIFTKFALMTLIFLFVSISLLMVYGTMEKLSYEMSKVGENYYLNDTSDTRIIINKKDGSSITNEDFNKIEKIDNVERIIHYDNLIDTYYSFDEVGVDTDYDHYSFYGQFRSIKSFNDKLDYGRMPENDREILVDTMTYSKMFEIEAHVIYKVDILLEKEVVLNADLLKYKIVGIVSLGSPSIYVSNKEFINIIDNSYEVSEEDYYVDYYEEETDKKVYDYMLYNDKIKIVKGNTPVNEYEVMVNYDLKEEFKLNSYTDKIKIAGNKLKVVDYYTSPYNIDYYFVNTKTVMINLITESDSLTIYSSDNEKTINQFNIKNKNVMDIYESDRLKYVGVKSQSMIASLGVAIVILAISLFEIIFMTRSSFLSRIKEVGIYRAIGVKKSDIYKMFIGEAFAISTLTSLPAVLIMSYCLKIISSMDYIGMDYKMNIFITILCLIITYGFNILVSLFPVIGTLVKTPA